MKLKILLPNGPAVSQLKELKTYVHTKNYVKVLLAGFFFLLFLVLEHAGSYFLNPGMEAVSPTLERVLIAGPLGKSSY